MKFDSILFFCLVGYAAAGGNGGTLNTCAKQSNCFTYEITEEPASECTGQCQMKVCLTLNTGMDGCIKSGSISHTCLAEGGPESSICNPNPFATNVDYDGGLYGYLRENGMQCKIVTAGSVATFVLKDGGTCTQDYTDPTGVTTCRARTASDPSCSGSGNVGKECYWSIQTPSCSGSAPTPAGPSGPTPSGPTPSGPTPSGPTPSGPTPSGPTPSGPTPAGPSGPTGPAAIKIDKTVLLAGSNTAPASSCNPGKEVVQGKAGQQAVYCYEVTNTGGEPLTNVQVGDTCLLAMSYTRSGALPPGGSFRVPYTHTMNEDMSVTGCQGTVVGTPQTSGGSVSDSDPAGHNLSETEVECSMTTTNTVVNGQLMVNNEETCTYCACE